jgi:hypothetical protein
MVCLLLAAALAWSLWRRAEGAIRGRLVAELMLGAGLAAAMGLLQTGGLHYILSILTLLVALAANLEAIRERAGRQRPHYAALAMPLLAAVQIGLTAGWLLTRGRSLARVVAADQTALSLVILAMVFELLLFRRWKEAGGRGNGSAARRAGRPSACVVWLGNARAWGLIPLAAVFLLMTMSREGAQFGVAALALLFIGQGIWQWLALVVGQERAPADVSAEPQHVAHRRT